MLKHAKFLLPLLLSLTPLFSSAQSVYDKKVSTTTSSNTDEGEADIAISTADTNKMCIGFMQSSPTSVLFKLYHSANESTT